MGTRRTCQVSTHAFARVGIAVEIFRAVIWFRAEIDALAGEIVTVLIRRVAYAAAAIHLAAFVSVVVACLWWCAVVVGVTAGFTVSIAYITPLALLALFRSTARGHTVIVYADITRQGTVYIRHAFGDTVPCFRVAPGELGIVAIRVGLAAGGLGSACTKVALEPNTAIVVALAHGRRRGTFVVFAHQAGGTCTVFPGLAR